MTKVFRNISSSDSVEISGSISSVCILSQIFGQANIDLEVIGPLTRSMSYYLNDLITAYLAQEK